MHYRLIVFLAGTTVLLLALALEGSQVFLMVLAGLLHGLALVDLMHPGFLRAILGDGGRHGR